MKSFEKEIMVYNLKLEEDVLKALKLIYKEALKDIELRTKALLLDATEDAMLHSKIYQKKYQDALKAQIEVIINKLNEGQYETIKEYLEKCYEEGFIEAQYAIQKQGVPLIFPIIQEDVVTAIKLESKISEGLYRHLGKDTTKLKKQIAAEISRGVASSMSYSCISRNLSNTAGIHFNYASRIVRTEGGRIQTASMLNLMKKADGKGAEIMKRWDASLDKRTRSSHVKVDGEIRGLNENFSNGLMCPHDPNGKAEEVINCRCVIQQKAKWLLEYEETKYLGNAKEMSDEQLQSIAGKLNISTDELRKYSKQIIPVKAKDYEDFKRQYEKIWNYKEVE